MLSLVFIVVFVLCFSIAVFCVLIGHELINTYKAIFYRFYLYYLIAFMVFAIYAFWGQIGMQVLLASMDTTVEVERIVKSFMPILGLPFLIIAMIMFIRMAFALVAKPMTPKAHYLHLIPCLVIAMFIFGLYNVNNGMWAYSQKVVLPLALLLGIECMYLLFFTTVVRHHLKKMMPQRRIVIHRFTLLLFVGLMLRGTSLVFDGVATWSLPPLILTYFISHVPALWYVRQQSDLLFEPIGAERPNTDKKFLLYKKYRITPREQQVIEQICLGKTNQQIANTLFISLQTVKDHTHRIYTKVGINSRMKLVQLINN